MHPLNAAQYTLFLFDPIILDVLQRFNGSLTSGLSPSRSSGLVFHLGKIPTSFPPEGL